MLSDLRFFIHKIIEKLAHSIVGAYGSLDIEKAMLFPTISCAARCQKFLQKQNPQDDHSTVRVLELVPNSEKPIDPVSIRVLPRVVAVIYPKRLWPTAKAFWQHTGEGIQSRRAEFCQQAFDEGLLIDKNSVPSGNPRVVAKGPKRYQRPLSQDLKTTNVTELVVNGSEVELKGAGVRDSVQFVEERFGRNLDTVFAAQAKLAIRKRIAGSLTSDVDLPGSLESPPDTSRERIRGLPGFSEDDVYLFSCGMNAIFTTHRTLMSARGELKSVMHGFPYVDTLKVLEKFGPGVTFHGHGNAEELDDLEKRLVSGERILAVFCEFPGNPLLKTPDVARLRSLANKYDFAIVIDETIGNFLNVHILPYADIVVSSLTKIFSGDSNVMGGAMILNPHSKYYHSLKSVLDVEYEDNQFEEDSICLERNSRDFVSRVRRVNHNAEAVADLLQASPKVKQVNYPKYSDTKAFYDACRLPDGGYGGLLSATFHSVKDAELFYDNLDSYKGPSLGTNFTLSSPFVLLAHYAELEWAAQFGCEVSLIRFSVGLEDTDFLVKTFERALEAIPG